MYLSMQIYIFLWKYDTYFWLQVNSFSESDEHNLSRLGHNICSCCCCSILAILFKMLSLMIISGGVGRYSFSFTMLLEFETASSDPGSEPYKLYFVSSIHSIE